jgi:hypothetical protein
MSYNTLFLNVGLFFFIRFYCWIWSKNYQCMLFLQIFHCKSIDAVTWIEMIKHVKLFIDYVTKDIFYLFLLEEQTKNVQSHQWKYQYVNIPLNWTHTLTCARHFPPLNCGLWGPTHSAHNLFLSICRRFGCKFNPPAGRFPTATLKNGPWRQARERC